MQQLNQWSQENDRIILVSAIPQDLEAFETWVEQLVASCSLEAMSMETGADRAQLHFRLCDCDFLLHFEALCEALWIEPMNSQSQDKIGNLIRQLD